jgi:hypothetical protein
MELSGVGGKRAEGRGQRAEGRGQRAEGRGQRAEGRKRRAYHIDRTVLVDADAVRAEQTAIRLFDAAA